MKIKICKNVCDAAKAVLRAKFLVLKDYVIALYLVYLEYVPCAVKKNTYSAVVGCSIP